ncbi:hypothetical protein [Roseateles puraquae]|uniref:hypothetical protein n=1 Tax=Roseateles puraquae TaxID=431059 RepID=UPI0031E48393
MRPQAIYEELRGQQLTSVVVHDPWGGAAGPRAADAGMPLFGALALGFNRHTLLVTSPLRYLRSQEGTRYGLSDGCAVSFGFRALLCESEQADALVSWRLGLPALDGWWGWHANGSPPVIGRTLRADPVVCAPDVDGLATIHFDFGEGPHYRLSYRPELDGAIQFAAEGAHIDPGVVEVSQPAGPFGWLHPRSVKGFVLDDCRWRNAEQWPIDVRRQYRDADPKGPEVRQLLLRAWCAFFRQNPPLLRRLLALSVPVHVVGLPDGIVESVQAALRAEVAMSAPAPAADASAAPASAQPAKG